jgi:hypothetical protein
MGHHKIQKGQRMESAKINNNEIGSKTFNNYFVWTAEHIVQNISNNSSIKGHIIQKSIQIMTKIDGKPLPKIRLTNTTPNEIEKLINSLQSKSSYGYNISTKILKISTPFIISSFNYICNKAISIGIFSSL